MRPLYSPVEESPGDDAKKTNALDLLKEVGLPRGQGDSISSPTIRSCSGTPSDRGEGCCSVLPFRVQSLVRIPSIHDALFACKN